MKTIIARNTAPKAVAGSCPDCGSELHNPGMDQHIGLSMTVRWRIKCSGCGRVVIVENPRYKR